MATVLKEKKKVRMYAPPTILRKEERVWWRIYTPVSCLKNQCAFPYYCGSSYCAKGFCMPPQYTG